jgi:hypothetical protein
MFRCRVSLLILAWCGILCAQDAPANGTITGHVFSKDGTRLGGATVTIAGASTFVAVTETASDPGKYSSPAIPLGKYNVAVQKDGYRLPAAREVTLEKDGLTADFVMEEIPCDLHPGTTAWTETVQTFWVGILFLASIWLVRWNNIARPNREMLRAAIENARVRFKDETGKEVEADSGLDKLLKAAKDATAWDWWHSTIDFLFWSRGQEITGWARIREFERDAIGELPAGKLEMIRARLISAELDLLDIDKTHAKTIAANIKDVLALPTTDDPSLTAEQREKKKKEQEDVLRATLVEALTYLNDEDVNTFAQLVGWQTKAVWLAGVGCSLVVVLTYAVGNPVLFIAGATGGYLSRLARALKRADVPTDYGASWTTLFLSPVVGGLSGWFGILLIVVLADTKFNVLGSAFQAVKWCQPLAPFTLGIAFALGFSERLFDGIISGLEKKVDQDREAATKPAQTGPSSTPKQSVPPGGPSALVPKPETTPDKKPEDGN